MTRRRRREETEEKLEPKVKATKPGWRPASKVAGLKAKPGFKARWVSNDPSNISRKKAEGWIVMKPSDNVGEVISQEDVNDGNPLHDGIRYRDMIAMMLPNELVAEREQYYKKENQHAMGSILGETDGKMANMGVQTYAPKGQSGRIVID